MRLKRTEQQVIETLWGGLSAVILYKSSKYIAGLAQSCLQSPACTSLLALRTFNFCQVVWFHSSVIYLSSLTAFTLFSFYHWFLAFGCDVPWWVFLCIYSGVGFTGASWICGFTVFFKIGSTPAIIFLHFFWYSGLTYSSLWHPWALAWFLHSKRPHCGWVLPPGTVGLEDPKGNGFRQQLRQLVWLACFLFLISGPVPCCLLSSVWKTVVSYILSSFLVPIIPSLQETEPF